MTFIKPKPIPSACIKGVAALLTWFLKKRFHKLLISEIEIKPAHSFLLMCNHFSFWDGLFAGYLSYHAISKKQKMARFYIMSLKKQMEKNKWLKYLGSFSVDPKSKSLEISLKYAADVLKKPGNLLLMYPQGRLESSYVRKIEFQEGISRIIPQIQGNCQLIWCSVLTEYFENLKPSVYFDMLDLGTNHDFNFEILKQKVNEHHRQAIQKRIRFTKEQL